MNKNYKVNDAKRQDNIKAIASILKEGGCSKLTCAGDLPTRINKFDCPLMDSCKASKLKVEAALEWVKDNNVNKEEVFEYLF